MVQRKGVVTEYRRGTKWQRGMRIKGVVVARRKEQSRKTGGWVRNAAVGHGGRAVNAARAVNAKGDPRGQRTRRCRLGERRGQGRGKLRAMSVYEV